MQALLVWVAVAALSATSQAAVIQMSFGNAAVPPGEATNSPYHTENPSFTGSVWNNLSNADVAPGGLVDADGSTAAGIGLNLGSSSGGPTINLANNPASASTLGDLGGIYSLIKMRTAIWNGGGPNDDLWVGGRIDGLTSGDYELLVWGNNGNVSLGSTPQAVYAIADSSGIDSFDISGTTPMPIANNDNSAWILGASYAKHFLTVGDGDSIYFAIDGTVNNQDRGFLSGLQLISLSEPQPLVPIPEPSSAVLLLLSGLALLPALGRRKSRRSSSLEIRL